MTTVPMPDRAHRRWLGGLLLGTALAAVGIVAAVNLGGYPARSIDEGIYASQAWSVLARAELAPYTYWYDHPPGGWLLLAGVLGVTRGLVRAANVIVAGREVVVGLHLVSCALLYVWARRLDATRGFAALAVILFGLSPLTVFFARQVLLDNLAVPFVLAAFVLASSPSRRLLAGAGAGLCFGLACLTKETSLLVLPALAWQLWQCSQPSTRRYVFTVAGSLFALTLSIYALLAVLRGELLPGEGHVSLWDGIAFQLVTRDATAPLWQGGAQQVSTLQRWLWLDPWLLTGGLAAVLPAFAVRRLRPTALAGLLLVASAATTRYLPAMYVVAFLPFGALLMAGVGDRVWRLRMPVRFLRRAGALVAVAGVVVAGVVVAPVWADGLQRPLVRDEDQPVREAYEWIMQNAEPGARLLVDEPLRIELVARGGWAEQDAVWTYKLDPDLEVAAANPGGWRDFDYVITTATSRGDANLGAQASLAMRESELVATFEPPGQVGGGSALVAGQELIEIRAITNGDHLTVVRDNRLRIWVTDQRGRIRYPVSEEKREDVVQRYGEIRTRNARGRAIYLTGWRERPLDELLAR